MGDLSKEEFQFIKQQLFQQQPGSKNRNKSNNKKKDQFETNNKVYVIPAVNNTEKQHFSSKERQMESINVYLQQTGTNKKLKKLKKKRNQDLVEICNDTTINTNIRSTINEENIDNNEENKQDENDQESTSSKCDNNSQSDNLVCEQIRQQKLNLQTVQSDQDQVNLFGLIIAESETQHIHQNQYQTQTHYSSDKNYKKMPISKQSAPSSLRKSTKLASGSQIMNIGNVKNSYKDGNLQNMIERSFRNSSNHQGKSVDQNNISTRYQQQQSPREIQRQILSKVGIQMNKMDQIKTLIDQQNNRVLLQDEENPMATPLINSHKTKKISKPGQQSITKKEFLINQDEIMEQIQNNNDNFQGESVDELESTQYLLNYIPIQPSLDVNEDQFQTIKESNQKNEFYSENHIIQCDNECPYDDQNNNNNKRNGVQIQPNSTKNKENIVLQPQININPAMTCNQFNQQQIGTVKQQKSKAPKKQKIDQIQCQAVSVEPYIKRNMAKLGWNDVLSNNTFHIRFDITDKEGNQAKLKNGQWYNHFPSNRELTTKAGLCKNLWQQCYNDYELKVEKFFPRCYDLSDQKQIDQFLEDFQMTAILSIIKRYAQYFKQKTNKITDYLFEYKKKKEYKVNKVFKQNFKLKCSKVDQLLSGAGNLLGNDILRLAMKYAKVNVVAKQKIDKKAYQ